MSNYPENSQKKNQQNAFCDNYVGGNVSIENLTQTVNQILQPNNNKNSFCGLLKWINEKYDYLEDLHPEHGKEILKMLRQAPHDENLYFTAFETRVLNLIINYCHYFSQAGKARSEEFADFTEEDYLFELNKIANTQEKIRIQSIKISDLIADKKMSLIVKQLESSDGF